MTALEAAVQNLKNLAIREHMFCEDCWYTCPKHPEGCCDPRKTDCNCGADLHNAMIAIAYQQVLDSIP